MRSACSGISKHRCIHCGPPGILGGHSHTGEVEHAGRRLAMDTGFIVCNARNCPNLLSLLDQVGVQRCRAAMSFSVSLGHRYLLPMAGMMWSCSPAQAAEYPTADFICFFEAHGLFTTTRQPQ